MYVLAMPSFTLKRASTEDAVKMCALPCKPVCLGLHDVLTLLRPAVCLPEVHGSQLHVLPVKALSASHLEALHDSMDVDIVPC